jgi:amino acid adenylation domain-containing protein
MLPVQLLEWNKTEAEYPRHKTVAELFREQAARTPDALAVAAQGRRFSYRELDERSSRLAERLVELGVRPENLVGVAMGRSELLPVSLLAILKAGGAYVPLDPTHPPERLSLVMEDSGMAVLLTTAEVRGRLPLGSGGLAVLNVDEGDVELEGRGPGAKAPEDSSCFTARLKSCPDTPCLPGPDSSAPDRGLCDAIATQGELDGTGMTYPPESSFSATSLASAAAHNLAYVIYTSGSTGKPKGVMVENRNVVNFFTGMDRAIGCAPGVWLAVTSVSFDISVLELLWTLTRGFAVVIHGDEGTATIAEEIRQYGVTHLQMTPSLARMLTLDARAFAALGSLKQMLLGGEALPAALVHHLRTVFRGEIHNMYGPTESTIWSTTCLLEEVGSSVSIGRPIANTQIYLLDADLEPVPLGEIGELYIGGDGVARGYWNRPELTAERFVEIAALAPGRIYRTGDLARFLPDGNIEFLGRADFQVKLRGHRIEPGEIEALLEAQAGIRQAVVVVREDREGDKRLVAYLVADHAAVEPSFLKFALEARLPDPMIPSAYVFLASMPLTGNGKINRKALLALPPPVPTTGAGQTAIAEQAGNRPESEMERMVSRVWQEALNVNSVGVDDNFFDLGAHSLTVAEVQAKLQQELGRGISLVDLFQFSTVRTLASHLAGTQSLSQVSDRAQRRRMARGLSKGTS